LVVVTSPPRGVAGGLAADSSRGVSSV